jgi:hypothetical protein
LKEKPRLSEQIVIAETRRNTSLKQAADVQNRIYEECMSHVHHNKADSRIAAMVLIITEQLINLTHLMAVQEVEGGHDFYQVQLLFVTHAVAGQLADQGLELLLFHHLFVVGKIE